MLSGSVGLTATHGSTSALTKFVPGPPIVHAANGLGPDASTSGPTAAPTDVARMAASAAIATNSGNLRGMDPSLLLGADAAPARRRAW